MIHRSRAPAASKAVATVDLGENWATHARRTGSKASHAWFDSTMPRRCAFHCSRCLNTANPADTTWFVVLLVGGLLSVGFLATLAYVIAGPDGQPTAVPARDGRNRSCQPQLNSDPQFGGRRRLGKELPELSQLSSEARC